MTILHLFHQTLDAGLTLGFVGLLIYALFAKP